MGSKQNLLIKKAETVRILHQQFNSHKAGYYCLIHQKCLHRAENSVLEPVTKRTYQKVASMSHDSRKAIWCLRCGMKIRSCDLLAKVYTQYYLG